MDNITPEEELYEEAKRRVEAKRKFYRNLAAYVVVNVLLIIIWAFPAGGGYQWFWFPLGGWGLFILLEYIQVFMLPGSGDKAAIEKEMDKMRRG
ncbi:MAG: 2TM domain-containing protein [Dehalococcoidales bacterium]|nr:MAG: 2TM domain-containing protein [Dehalococcoidales bacterium]